ncbi:GtrA family protein [Collimonas sp.]|uniref:GtrA family protein n=1 Tax=Collimonas sp. TaxID=1963772 RepID=UPI002CE85BFA|nr:GtrA family protein [Collimonas sp.]HWW04942.1 GtrA family protein [Collimonas sp.]
MTTTEIYRSAKQLLRYGLVGIVSNLAGYLLFLLITYWGVEPKIAMTLLYVVGATIGFFGNRQWAFAYKGTLLGAGARYFIAHIFGYLINFLILLTFVDRLGYSHRWVQAGAIIVVAGFLFVAFKYFVFPKAESCIRGSE